MLTYLNSFINNITNTLIVVQAKTITAVIPIFAYWKKGLWLFNIFFYVLCSITMHYVSRERKCWGQKSMKEELEESFKLHFTYPFAKSNRKSWNPMVFLSHVNHPIISLLTKFCVWSIFGNPLKFSPVLLFPYKGMKIYKHIHLQYDPKLIINLTNWLQRYSTRYNTKDRQN